MKISAAFLGLSLFALSACAQQSAPRVSAEVNDSDLSRKVAAFARAAVGKKFGRGECTDLAYAALDAHGGAWNRLNFGRKINPGKESIRPGDIIQFDKARIEWKRGTKWGKMWLGTPDHTAIVTSAAGLVVEFAHQNYNKEKRVGLLTINLNEITSGKYTVYRPVKKTE